MKQALTPSLRQPFSICIVTIVIHHGASERHAEVVNELHVLAQHKVHLDEETLQ